MAKQRKFDVEVYEPAVNPGGYYKHFIIHTDSPDTAADLAIEKGKQLWPDNKGLAVFRIQELTSA